MEFTVRPRRVADHQDFVIDVSSDGAHAVENDVVHAACLVHDYEKVVGVITAHVIRGICRDTDGIPLRVKIQTGLADFLIGEFDASDMFGAGHGGAYLTPECITYLLESRSRCHDD